MPKGQPKMDSPRNPRVNATYFSKWGTVSEWDLGIQDKLKEAFGAHVSCNFSDFDMLSGGRLLSFDVSPEIDPVSVKKEIRKFFKNRRVTGVKIEIFKDELN